MVAVALAAAACSSPGTTAARATTTTAATSAELATAQQSLLVLSDFPAGWTASGSATTSSGSGSGFTPAQARTLARCVGVPLGDITGYQAEADSPTFNSPDQSVQVGDAVTPFGTAAVARAQFLPFTQPRVAPCIAKVFGPVIEQSAKSGGGSGPTLGALKVTAAAVPNVADRTAQFDLAIPTTESGLTLTAHDDLVVFVKGSYAGTINVMGLDPQQSLVDSLARKAADKLP